jgi:TP901 family phage tail tape measure protein
MAKTDPQSIGEGMITIAAPFNLKGGEYAEVANFLQKVDQASVSTIPDLFEGMKMVAGQAAMMKVSWKDTLIAMGTLSQSGLKGTMGGTALGDFFERLVAGSRITRKMIAAVNADLARQGKQPLKFWDDKGHLKQLPVIIKNLRESMSGFTDEKKLLIMHKIFETQGGRAAAALMHEGAGSWEEVAAGVGKAADIQEKLNIRMEGFNANLKSLSGTSQTTAASFFSPWLEPLNAIIQKANDATAALGKFADKHPKTTDTVNGVLAAGVATAAGYGAYKLAKAGWYGGKVLKGLRGLPGASLAMGVAEGKAVQAATGVQPVFITNWPNSFGTAAAVANAGGIVAGGGGRAALAGTLATAGLVTSVVAAPLISKIISDAQRANGWDSHAFGRGTKEYEVMGVGGKKRDINLTVQIDSQGRLISRSDDMGSQIKTVRRGAFFDDMLVSH